MPVINAIAIFTSYSITFLKRIILSKVCPLLLCTVSDLSVDYGCSLQREILIQGRLYISKNHICFHANIFGWVTDLSIPVAEIESLEKKMTAFVIPNAIQITTRQATYSFVSFLSRDTTFDVMYHIWRLVRVNADSVSFGMSIDVPAGSGESPTAIVAGIKPKKTQCACSNDGSHFSETVLDTVLPGTPDRIHNLIFMSGFIKEFFSVNQKYLGGFRLFSSSYWVANV